MKSYIKTGNWRDPGGPRKPALPGSFTCVRCVVFFQGSSERAATKHGTYCKTCFKSMRKTYVATHRKRTKGHCEL